MSRTDHDKLFKQLLQVFFIEFLELFFPEVLKYLDRDSVVFLDKEIFSDINSGERRELDLVAKAKFLGKEAFFLIHLENQSEARGKFNRRMFRYFSRLLDLHDLPIYPIAIFSYDEPKRTETSSYQVAFPDFTVLSFNYRVLQLNQLNWRDFLNKPNPIASALMAKMDIKANERPKVKLECLRLLATLKLDRAKMQLISGFVDTYLKLNAQEIQLFNQEIEQIIPSEKEQVMQIVTSWMEDGIQQGLQQGIQQGIQQGLQQGVHEGESKLILKMLNRRFGQISDELNRRIKALSVSELEQLGEAIFDFQAPTDLEKWFENK